MNKFEQKLAKEPKNYAYIIIIAVIVVGFTIWSASSIKPGDTTKDAIKLAQNIIKGIFSPDTNFLFRLDQKGVIYLLFETICIAFLGTIIGAIIAMPFAFLSAKKMVTNFYWVGRFATMVVRTIPAFIYGLMFIGVTGPGPLAGVFTMSVISIGMITKLYIDAIEDIDFKIVESLQSLGCTKLEQIRYGILPQLYSNLISIVIYRFDMNLRDATVLGLVGAGGIGAPLIFAINAYRWNEVGAILCGIIVLILVIEMFSNRVRRYLARGY